MAGGPLQVVISRIRGMVAGKPRLELTDRQLLDRFATQRDEGAFATVVERHGPMVLSVCRRVLRDAHEAEDAFQSTFLVLARKAASVHWHESVANWLHGVAYRVAMKARSRLGRVAVGDPSEPPSKGQDPLADMTCREMEAMLDEELQRLPSKYRQPLILCYLEGQTRDETAETLGWSVGAVKGALERGRNLLRKRLTRRGVSISTALLAGYLLQPQAAASIPATLIGTTVEASLAWSSGGALAGVASARVQSLAEAVLYSFAIARIKALTLVLAFLAAAGGSVAWGLGWVSRPIQDSQLVTLTQVIEPDLQPTPTAPPTPPAPTSPVEQPDPPSPVRDPAPESVKDPPREKPEERPRDRGRERDEEGTRGIVGSVLSVDRGDGKLTILSQEDEGHRQLSYRLSPRLRIRLSQSERPGELADLLQGLRVKLFLNQDGDTVESIELIRRDTGEKRRRQGPFPEREG